MTNQMNEENIRVAAYYIWEQAGRPEGQDKECWNKACEQLYSSNNSEWNNCNKKQCKSSSASKTKNATASTSKSAKSQSSLSKNKKTLA